MKTVDRRKFILQTSAMASVAAVLPSAVFSRQSVSFPKERKFRLCLNAGAIGVRANQEELLEMAHKYGFEAMVGLPGDLAAMDDGKLKDFQAKMKEWDITWGAAGLPVQFRRSDQEFREGLTKLPEAAAACERAGITRMNTWIMPMHAELTYLENFHEHKTRLKEVANILGHYGVRLGLEYVGPKTMMVREKFSFIRTMKESKELHHAIGEDNVGFVLDSFHWFCAGETPTDLLTLDKEDIVTCDLNDARAGISADDQVDGQRELPFATGTIDLKGFLGALVQIGYDGPIRAEPFNKELNDMEDEAALKATAEAMRKAVG